MAAIIKPLSNLRSRKEPKSSLQQITISFWANDEANFFSITKTYFSTVDANFLVLQEVHLKRDCQSQSH